MRGGGEAGSPAEAGRGTCALKLPSALALPLSQLVSSSPCILCGGPDTQHTRGAAVAVCSVSNLASLFILPSHYGAVGRTSFLTLPKTQWSGFKLPCDTPPTSSF